ncbi:MAG TPA: lysophospholipid acyltransferase family protein [Holophagaceae bacterium]|nr:lysophospholipid acyltransferase family protein [Holophagaceae bacterium]
MSPVAARVEIKGKGRPLGGPVDTWIQFRLIPFLGSQLAKLWHATLRVRVVDGDAVQDLVRRDQRFILSFWHRRLFAMPLAYPFQRKDRGVAILSSDSRDGERSAATWRWFGIHAVRGTASDDGAKALVRMIQAVRQGWDFGITPDGPRGPLRELKPGVIALARKTGAWVVPVTVAFDRAWTLKTWDRMVLPLPFSTAVVRYGEPFQVPARADDTEEGAKLQAVMDRLEAWAEEAQHG